MRKSNMADKDILSWYTVHEEVLESETRVDSFLQALNIWIDKPQVLNRRLMGSSILQSFFATNWTELLCAVLNMTRMNQVVSRKKLLGLKDVYQGTLKRDKTTSSKVVEVKIRSLLPRESRKYDNVLEMIIEDKSAKRVMFIPFEEDKAGEILHCKVDQAYAVKLSEKSDNKQSLSLSILETRTKGNGITCPTVEWLKSHLLPKIHKWILEDGINVKTTWGQSLRLVPIDKYSQKYEQLKEKYKHFVEFWPERTDPHKFVYEDVAIATYLILLWEGMEETKKNWTPQKFVDLGCGNGLLVHILTNEGHLGKGVDLRRRKVWESFDDKTILEICSLDPSTETFPDVDWLIGNHSDELTPWIPIIAARSSYACKYLVLPCCFHDFYGKFQRCDSNNSQYRSYLDFVQKVGRTCGFDVKEDVLRIPSTKRVCQIGQQRTYSPEEQTVIDRQISAMLGIADASCLADKEKKSLDEKDLASYEGVCDKCGPSQKRTISEMSATKAPNSRQFIPRCNTEPVRNCTRVDKNLLDMIVRIVAKELLSRRNQEKTDDKTGLSKSWNKGGSMELSEVSALFDQDVLSQLRCEAGGIKTVLKNFHHIFKVQGGVVVIRDWREDSPCKTLDKKKQAGAKKCWKTKICWFFTNHPDGCPLPVDQCRFAHGMKDLRTL